MPSSRTLLTHLLTGFAMLGVGRFTAPGPDAVLIANTPLPVVVVNGPGPSPTPTPTPVPDPTPTPTPEPAPSSGRLEVILVYNDRSADLHTQVSVNNLRNDPGLPAKLKAYDARWECLPADAAWIDSSGLRKRMPDPAQLPVLVVYDKQHYYGLDGKPLGPGPLRVPVPDNADELVAVVKRVRGVK